MQAKALTPIRGLVVMFVARLRADLALLLSRMPSSVNPAVLGSANTMGWENKFETPGTHFQGWKLIPGLVSAIFMSSRNSFIFRPLSVTVITSLIIFIIIKVRILSSSTLRRLKRTDKTGHSMR